MSEIKQQIFKEITESMSETYRMKNADYGDSFSIVRKEYPYAILIRLSDKLERVKTLMETEEQNVNDESIDDTLMDLANYCIMELIERKLDKAYEEAMKTKPANLDINDEQEAIKYELKGIFGENAIIKFID